MLFPTYSENPHDVQIYATSFYSCVHVVLCPFSSCEWYQMTGVVFYYNGLCENLLKILQDFRNFNKFL